MRRRLFFISAILFFYSFNLISQEQNNKFLSVNANWGVGIYTLEKLDSKIGFSSTIAINLKIKKNIVGINWNFGGGILNEDDILKNSIHSFSEINLVYGRVFPIRQNLSLTLYGGVGFTDQTKLRDDRTEGNIGFPTRCEFTYKVINWIDVGVSGQINFNRRNNISSYQVFSRFILN